MVVFARAGSRLAGAPFRLGRHGEWCSRAGASFRRQVTFNTEVRNVLISSGGRGTTYVTSGARGYNVAGTDTSFPIDAPLGNVHLLSNAQSRVYLRDNIVLPTNSSRIRGDGDTENDNSGVSAPSSADVLVAGGFVAHGGGVAGFSSMLPLGLRAVQLIEEQIDRALRILVPQSSRVELPVVAPRQEWDATGRLQVMGDDLYGVVTMGSRAGTSPASDTGSPGMILTPTHEESMTSLAKHAVFGAYGSGMSTRSLPLLMHQFGPKFRNELRPRGGLMRGRAFRMLDLYSFDETKEKALTTFGHMAGVFERILVETIMLPQTTVRRLADGGAMGDGQSVEYLVPCQEGQDAIPLNAAQAAVDLTGIRHLKSLHSSQEYKAVEIGHVFHLGSKYTSPLDVVLHDDVGAPCTPQMGSYGIGTTRILPLMAATYSVADERARWRLRLPAPHAPVSLYVVVLDGTGSGALESHAAKLVADVMVAAYREGSPNTLGNNTHDGAQVLHPKQTTILNDVIVDNRQTTFGVKMRDAELCGAPIRVVIGTKTAKSGTIDIIVDRPEYDTAWYQVAAKESPDGYEDLPINGRFSIDVAEAACFINAAMRDCRAILHARPAAAVIS